MITREPANVLQRFASPVGQMEGVASPIGWVSLPFEQAPLLELVDQDDEPTWEDAQLSRQSLLADPAGHTHEP